jgi:ubiquinone/menaquinone biosynthesis C-methylase UbiE
LNPSRLTRPGAYYVNNAFSFDRAVKYYDQTRGFPPGEDDKAIAALIDFAGLKPEDQLLEVGIGTGRIARPLAAALGPSHHITGIDISRPMMAQIAAQLPVGVRPPMLAEANATLMPFPPGTFHAIIFVHILHLIRDWQIVLDQCQQLLAPGGFFIGGWNHHPPEASAERIGKKFQEIAKSHGISIERRGISIFSDVLNHLSNAHATEIMATEWTATRAPRQQLQAIAERHFSSAWLVPDEVFPAIYVELEAWAQKEWPNLDEPIDERRGFKWMKVEFE